jgi:uncharacterized protein (DUF885 family)
MKLPILRDIAPLVVMVLAVVANGRLHGQQHGIDEFFDTFTAEWMQGNPNAATSTRYFTGDAQDRLERQVTALTPEYRRERVRLARRGLTELRQFDRAQTGAPAARGVRGGVAMTAGQLVSAELMEWQLETIVEGEKFDDLTFPLEQFGGANVNLVNTLTVNHPLRTEKDAENYLARLALVGTRMVEAIADARRIATRGTIPPRFILDATITQLQQFVSGAPGRRGTRRTACRTAGGG